MLNGKVAVVTGASEESEEPSRSGWHLKEQPL